MDTSRIRFWLRRLATHQDDREEFASTVHELAGDPKVDPDEVLRIFYTKTAKVYITEYLFEEGLRRAKNVDPSVKLPSVSMGNWQAWVWNNWMGEEEMIVQAIALMILAYRDGELAYRQE